MSSTNMNELACTYASLILHDDGVEITADKLNTLINAAGLEVDPIWASIFARALGGKDLDNLLFNFSAAPAPTSAPAATAAAATADKSASTGKKAEKKEEPKPESDDDAMGFGLFD